MENTKHMNKIFFVIVFLFYFSVVCCADPIDDTKEYNIYTNSPFYINSVDLPKLEVDAFDGDPQAAYKLGRFYQYCLRTKFDAKIAGVYYYMSRYFSHLGGYLRLLDLISMLNEKIDSNCDKVFELFTSKELAMFRSQNTVLANFILYHYYLKKGMHGHARRYSTLLVGRLSPRFLKSYEYIDKNYPIGIPLSRPHIESDELNTYTKLALLGDKSKATLLMAYYRYGNFYDERNKYFRDLWAYISYKLGDMDGLSILKHTYKQSVSTLFGSLEKYLFSEKDDDISNFVMYHNSSIRKDKEAERIYYNKLKSMGIDERLLDNSTYLIKDIPDTSIGK